MTSKFGSFKLGKTKLGFQDVSIPPLIQDHFTPARPKFVTDKMIKEAKRKLYLGLTQFGQKSILYQRKLEGDFYQFKINVFDTTSPYSKVLWTRGNLKLPNPNHPNPQKIIIRIGDKYLTQVKLQSQLFGTYSFCIQVNETKDVTILFSQGFNPKNKNVIVEYDGICECVDLESMQSSNPRCPLCYGTLFEGGYDRYFNPEMNAGIILVRKKSSSRSFRLEDFGYVTKNTPQFYTLPLPKVKDKDIIELVSGQFAGSRFFVSDWDPHVIGDNVISQWFNMMEITITDPVYKAKFL